MFRLIANHFTPARLPYMTRHNYAREMAIVCVIPWSMALIEGGLVGVLAAKAFHAPPFIIALLAAAPMIANITSFFWAHLARAKRKVPIYVAIHAAQLLLVAIVGYLPTNNIGLIILCAVIIAARCLFAGVLTIRSTIWRQNYPPHVRGQITGRLSQLATAFMVTASLIASLTLEANPHNYRILYPLAAAIATISVVAASRIRVRGERTLLRAELKPSSAPTPIGEATPIYDADPPAHRFSIFSVLKLDPVFRKYMVWQFFVGTANMMTLPVIIILISKPEHLDQGYIVSIALTMILPMAVASFALPAWGRLLDRMHIAPFRVRQCCIWVLSMILLAGGAALAAYELVIPALAVLTLARIANGLAIGAGILAWQLGHNDFASKHLVSLYMGIHQLLTGIRGCFAPFLGVALFSGWNALIINDTTLIPAFDGIGYYMFTICAILAAIATLGFHSLAKTSPKKRTD